VKVLYILPYDWGGMPHYTAEIANAVAEHADVTVVGSKAIRSDYFSNRVRIVKLFDPMQIEISNLQKSISRENIRGALSYRNIRAIERLDPDIIHLPAPLFPPLAAGLYLNRIDRKYPIVYTKHGIYGNSGFALKILEENVLGAAERMIKFQKFIVHTENDRKELAKKPHYSNKPIAVIPHGSYSFFDQYGSDGTAELNTLLFFGYIKEYKGLRYLLEAAPYIKKEIPGLRIIIAGEGDLSPYEDLIQRCGPSTLEIENSFLPDEQVAGLFRRSSLVVLPYSIMSGQSGILNIALAFHKPIIATDVGGFGEVVRDGVTGLLVPPKDPQALADATIRLLQDTRLREQMVAGVKKKADELSWGNIAKKHMAVYQDLVA
jgi:alpha-maltose-1-phosphate synthase